MYNFKYRHMKKADFYLKECNVSPKIKRKKQTYILFYFFKRIYFENKVFIVGLQQVLSA